MQATLPDALGLLGQCLELAARPPAAPGADRRASRLAEALRALWPGAAAYACGLGEGRAVLDGAGTARADWEEAAGGWLGGGGAGPWPVAGQHARAEPLPGHGLLAVALAEDAGADDAGRSALMRLFARGVAQRLDLEACAAERDRLRGLATLAEVGALSGPLIHSVNNFLNVVSLQLAVMARLVPEAPAAELASIRQQGKALAGLIHEWQRSRTRTSGAPERADLNALVAEAVAGLAAEPGVAFRLDLTPGLPDAAAAPTDVLLLVRLLAGDAAATLAGAGAVTLRTAAEAGQVVLRVEDTGPPIPADLLPRLFDTTAAARPGSGRLELAACESLARRRMQGAIQVENRPGGVVVTVRLRTAPSPGERGA